MKLVTIKDVAAAAGVSIGAVSKVLHGRGGNIRVSDATAQRIRDAAKSLNFRPNYHARSLRSGRSRSIGLVANPLPSIAARGPYHAFLVKRLVRHLNEADYALLLSPETLPISSVDPLTDGRFDGAVWIDTDPVGDLAWAYRKLPIPMVAINGAMESDPARGGWFRTDEARGMELALDHLTRLGHRRVTYLDLAEAGLPLAQRRSSLFDRRADELGLQAKRARWSSSWLAESRDDLPTAILCWNEATAAELLHAALALGISVPDDLSIIGFDGTPFGATMWPTVTTIVPPMETLVAHAVANLIVQIEEADTEPVIEIHPPTLQDLGSTAPPRHRLP